MSVVNAFVRYELWVNVPVAIFFATDAKSSHSVHAYVVMLVLWPSSLP